MKCTMLVAIAACGGLWIQSSAHADYTGLSVLLHHNDGADHDVYRVYANFTSPDDYLTLVSGNVASPLAIESRNANDTGVGSAFYNGVGPIASNNFPPQDATSGEGTWQHGTYATIGVASLVEAPNWNDVWIASPAFPQFIDGTALASNSISWSTSGPVEHGRAGYINSGPDTAFRTMIMQLAVNTGDHVRGTVNIGGFINTPLAGVTPFQSLGQTFNSYSVPGPAALSFLMLGAWAGGRRRSTHPYSPAP